MNRRLLLLGLLIGALASVAAVVTAVASASRDDVYEATVVLVLGDTEAGIDEPTTWINREAARLVAHGERLVAAEGVPLDDLRSIDLDRSARRLEVRVLAMDPAAAVLVAEALGRVAGADLARAGDEAIHRELRAAELALGLPSPEVAVRPHLDDGVGAEPPPDEAAAARAALAEARAAGVEALRPGVLVPVDPAVQVAPVPWRDAAEAALLVGLLALLAIAGTPDRWPVLAATDRLPRRAPSPWPSPDGRLFAAVLWLWLLTPLARRLADWAGLGSGRVLLVLPAIVTLVVVPVLVARRWPGGRVGRVTGLLAGPVVLAIGVGLLEHGPVRATLGAAAWLTPVLLAVWAVTVLDRAVVRRVASDWFSLGAAVAGGYAALQWATAPAWDTAWLAESGVRSFGDPEPFGLRAFGPFGAPATLGMFCAAALVVALWSPVRARPVAVIGAGTGLLLSLHRSSWLLVVVALVVLALRTRLSARRLLAAAAVMGAVVAVGAVVPSVRDRVADSVADGFGDRSLAVRGEQYEALLPEVLFDPVGSGFGAVGVGARSATGIDPATDSTVIDVLLVFGGPVGVFVMAVLLVALVRMRPGSAMAGPGPAAWAALVGVAAISPLANVFEGGAGAVTWTLALLVAAGTGGRSAVGAPDVAAVPGGSGP